MQPLPSQTDSRSQRWSRPDESCPARCVPGARWNRGREGSGKATPTRRAARRLERADPSGGGRRAGCAAGGPDTMTQRRKTSVGHPDLSAPGVIFGRRAPHALDRTTRRASGPGSLSLGAVLNALGVEEPADDRRVHREAAGEEPVLDLPRRPHPTPADGSRARGASCATESPTPRPAHRIPGRPSVRGGSASRSR